MKDIEMLQQTRALVERLIADLSENQLLIIPRGFRNNILWNVGHMVVAQQILHYKLSRLEMYISAELISNFRKGTSPADWSTTPDIAEVKHFLMELPARLSSDYKNDAFKAFQPYTTSTGPELRDIEDAIAFNNFHEGLHTGIIMALKKIIA